MKNESQTISKATGRPIPKITIPNLGKKENVANVSSSVNQIIRVGEESPAQTSQAQSDDIVKRAKTLEPAIDQIRSLVDGVGVRVIKHYAKKSFTPEQVSKLAGDVAMPPEACEVIKVSGARIAAKRITNPEALDFIAVGGALADWVTGIGFTIAELREMNKQNGIPKNNSQTAS